MTHTDRSTIAQPSGKGSGEYEVSDNDDKGDFAVSPGGSRRSVLEVVDCIERRFMTTLTSLKHKDVTKAKIKSLRTKLTVSIV
jgi:hypothetical protein